MSITSPSPDHYRRVAHDAGLQLVTLEPTEGAGEAHRPVNGLATQMLSEPICRRFKILPIAYREGVVTIASPRPVERAVEDLAAALTGRDVRFVITPSDQLERAVEAAFGATGAAEQSLAETEAELHSFVPGEHELDGDRQLREDEALEDETFERLGVDAPWQLGRILVARGLATPEQVEAALAEQQQTGSRLGEILVHGGVVDEHTMIEVIAQQFELPLVNLVDYDPDPAALAIIPEPITRELRCVPLAVDERAVYLACDDVLDEPTAERLQAYTQLQLRVLLAPRNDIDELMRRIYGSSYVSTATTELLNRFPEDCANRVVTAGQRTSLGLLLIAIVVLVVIFPLQTLIGLVGVASLFYTAVSLYKLKLVYSALGHRYEIEITPEEIAALDERTLPVYTILVPLYKEAAVIAKLASGVEGLDYPKTKLDVRLLCEENDEETIEAIRALALPPHFKLVIVPDSQPKTKPKACNFGLLQAEGEYVVIYDAEDRPDPDQLKRVVITFRKAAPSVTCIQCKLNYFNQEQNILTRWFAAEYSMWFDLLLPGLDAADVPIPLGGTSNHFITDRLIELAAWDPFNVTEDADLGIRLHKAGYQTAIIDSTTLEEANSQLQNWINQRSRWIKGYIQTWLVHMRHPIRLLRALGLKGWISFHLIVGGTFIFLLNPIFWLLTTVFLFTKSNFIRDLFPGVVFYLAALQLFIGNFVFVYLNVAGAIERRLFSLVKFALFSPLYWGLMSVAAWKGFIQLFTNPFYWEKTEHGLDQ